jgi:multidrug efflux pump subunit AcrA (membrane-fusion protein)
MRKPALFLAVLAIAAAGLWWLLTRPAAPPQVAFARVRTGTLTSRVVTNGRIEPRNDTPVTSPRDGQLRRILISEGQRVQAGQPIAELDDSALRTEISSHEAAIAQAKAELAQIERGGPGTAKVEIEAGLARVRQDLKDARGRLPVTEKLVAANAEPRQALEDLRARIASLEVEEQSLRRKLAALVPAGARAPAEARLHEAEAALRESRERAGQSILRAPGAGIVYELAVKKPRVVPAGEVIARIGQISTVRAVLYVDEPELGRVSIGLPVQITWDAYPEKKWSGRVDELPTRVVALHSRQVGEIRCSVNNEDRLLLPGANINAEIVSKVIDNTLLVPRNAVQRNASGYGVWVLEGDKVAWRPVQPGDSSLSSIQIISGLSDSEFVALPGETPLSPGTRVNPQLP